MTVQRSSVAAVIQALNTGFPDVADTGVGTPYHSLIHAGGRHVSKASHTIDDTGAQTDNLFTVTGVVRIISIRGIADSVTNSTTFSNVKFEVDDGGAQADLCAVVDASGIVAGGMIIRMDVSTAALVFINPSTAAVQDPIGGGPPPISVVSAPVIVSQKTGGVTTYIRISFTGDGDTNLDMDFEIEYEPLSHDGAIASV